MVVAAARQMVVDISRLQQEMLLTIAELRIGISMCKHSRMDCCFSERKEKEREREARQSAQSALNDLKAKLERAERGWTEQRGKDRAIQIELEETLREKDGALQILENQVRVLGGAMGQAKKNEAVRKHDLMKKVAKRMSNLCSSAAFEKWCLRIEEIFAQRAQEARKQNLMKRIVQRMTNMCMCTCFDAWKEFACEEVRKRGLMKRVASRLQGNSLGNAWERWCEGVEERRAAAAAAEEDQRQRVREDARRERLLLRVSRRLLTARVAAAFDKWQAECAAASQQREVNRRRSTENAGSSCFDACSASLVASIETLECALIASREKEGERGRLNAQLAAKEREVAHARVQQQRDSTRIAAQEIEVATANSRLGAREKELSSAMLALHTREEEVRKLRESEREMQAMLKDHSKEHAIESMSLHARIEELQDTLTTGERQAVASNEV